jgi:hypothetical protein
MAVLLKTAGAGFPGTNQLFSREVARRIYRELGPAT